MPLRETPYIDADRIARRISEIADEIDAAMGNRDPILLTVVDGAIPFSKALRAQLTASFTSGTVRAKSYAGTVSGGEVEISINFPDSFEGRDIVIIEDIVDTGRTADALTRVLAADNPASIRMATLLDKPRRRVVAYRPAWTGFTIEDHFVVGFGMDYNGAYRELPDIRILEP